MTTAEFEALVEFLEMFESAVQADGVPAGWGFLADKAREVRSILESARLAFDRTS